MAERKSLDYYENLVNTRSSIYDTITSALTIVKQFVIDKELILYGGMAIDFALQLHGDSIYADNQLPDYDFYSPNHAVHAYELGELLCKSGYENVSVINGFHITTMRVRIDFEVVADIGYAPPKVFNKIPYLKFGDIKFVHPHWQMSDIHSSLSLPFENPGKEVIFHRWKKDMTRYDRLYKYYPVVPTIDDNTGVTVGLKTDKYTIGGRAHYNRTDERSKMAKVMEIPHRVVTIPLEKFKDACICGWGAIDYVISPDSTITLKIPYGEPISLASYDYKKFISDQKLEVISYHSEYFGKLPRKVLCKTDIVDKKMKRQKMEIFDTFGFLLGSKKISDKHNVYVCNIQWSMLYLLINIISNDSPKIVFTAEEAYIRCRELVMNGDVPSITVYGTGNFSQSYLVSLKKNKATIYRIRDLPTIQPKSAYPKVPACSITTDFDPETSEYFMIDGREMTSLPDVLTDPFPEFTTSSIMEVPNN